MANTLDNPRSRRKSTESRQGPGASTNATSPRDEALQKLRSQLERLLLDESMLKRLKLQKQSIDALISLLRKERRRKTRSPAFQALLDKLAALPPPVTVENMNTLGVLVSAARADIEEDETPVPSKELLDIFRNLLKERKRSKYWNDYLDHLAGKSVSQVLRERHPQWSRLDDPFKKHQYFNKVYNGIQRLVEKCGGPVPTDESDVTKSK